jgi:hypothetical protein
MIKPKRRKAREWALHRTGLDGKGSLGICLSGHIEYCLCWYSLSNAMRIRPIIKVREILKPRESRKRGEK